MSQAETTEVDIKVLEQEGEVAADYIEGLLDIADFDGDIDMDVEGERALVSVVGATLDELVGKRGEVLEALQELTRLAVHRRTGNRTRLMLDIGGYRERRRAELTKLGEDVAAEVKQAGEPRPLAPMTPFERKIVHDAVAPGCAASPREKSPTATWSSFPSDPSAISGEVSLNATQGTEGHHFLGGMAGPAASRLGRDRLWAGCDR